MQHTLTGPLNIPQHCHVIMSQTRSRSTDSLCSAVQSMKWLQYKWPCHLPGWLVSSHCPASGNVSSINTLSIEYWQWMASQSHSICVMPQPTNINKVWAKFCFVVFHDLWEFRFWKSVSPDCSIYSAQTSTTATLHCSGVWVAIGCHWSLMIATMWPKLDLAIGKLQNLHSF